MLSPTLFLTAPIDQQATTVARPCSAHFPVARTTGEGTPDSHLHLVDGDGASLCEAFPQQRLERLHLAWHDVVPAARCSACEVIGSRSTRP